MKMKPMPDLDAFKMICEDFLRDPAFVSEEYRYYLNKIWEGGYDDGCQSTVDYDAGYEDGFDDGQCACECCCND